MFEEDELDFLPPQDEDVPDRLAKKWDEREKRKGLTTCPRCKKQILATSSFCAYCGDTLDDAGRLWKIAAMLILIFVLLYLGTRLLSIAKI